jgi:hypothetical protein
MKYTLIPATLLFAAFATWLIFDPLNNVLKAFFYIFAALVVLAIWGEMAQTKHNLFEMNKLKTKEKQ